MMIRRSFRSRLVPKLSDFSLKQRQIFPKRHYASFKRSKLEPSRHYVLSAVLTVFIPYTAYALYVSASAAKEIKIRHKLSLVVEGQGENYEGSLIKYSPLQILGRYENPFDEYRIQTVYEFFFNRIFELFQTNRGGIPSDKIRMRQLMPIHRPEWGPISRLEDCSNPLEHRILKEQSPNIAEKQDSAEFPIYNTWLGQSCNFVVYNGLKILTDPLFSDFLIHETFGPKRITEMPCSIVDVPTPDVILVSHNHPDHLDMQSLEHWGKGHSLWVVPAGMKSFMEEHHIDNFIELSWWETLELRKSGQIYHIASTPAMHWSGRTLLDVNESLWCSYLFSHNGKPMMFHAGDTGYVKDLYTRIKQRFGGNCKLALLPCGQYCPEWHQKPRHICPAELIEIAKDLDVQYALGVHWGTFSLSGEYFREPKERLESLAATLGLKNKCYCPELGETERFD
ncbi:FMP30 (YPL103C) [Zygosaccharomyces parabailii]|nr:FMP30 (YPL103C) [Zygosaccharomyces parabailii]